MPFLRCTNPAGTAAQTRTAQNSNVKAGFVLIRAVGAGNKFSAAYDVIDAFAKNRHKANVIYQKQLCVH
jgi:hypothetical protein